MAPAPPAPKAPSSLCEAAATKSRHHRGRRHCRRPISGHRQRPPRGTLPQALAPEALLPLPPPALPSLALSVLPASLECSASTSASSSSSRSPSPNARPILPGALLLSLTHLWGAAFVLVPLLLLAPAKTPALLAARVKAAGTWRWGIHPALLALHLPTAHTCPCGGALGKPPSSQRRPCAGALRPPFDTPSLASRTRTGSRP